MLTEPGRSDVLRQQFDTNFFGLVDVTNAVLPHMRDRFSGTIVLIGSRASWVPEIPVGILTIRSIPCCAYLSPMKLRVPVSCFELTSPAATSADSACTGDHRSVRGLQGRGPR